MTIETHHSGQAYVTANAIQISYDTFGADTGAPLMLIAGLGSQMVVWDVDFCRQLAARGYRVIRFDNRDIGLSTKFSHAGVQDLAALEEVLKRGGSPRLAYTLADMAEDVIGLIQALGYDRAHVVG